jgi:CheY-like chemotaxis protein
VRALLVEDNRTNQFLIEQMLKDHPIELVIAWNGAEAVEAGARERFDLVFMDMRMPVMDGLEATRAIRTGTGPCRDVPIIAMTANAYQEDQDACMAAGMTDFIAKPISRQALLDSIVRALPTGAGGSAATPAELSPGS